MDLVSKAGETLASSLVKSFTSNVIERWAKYRAERFFDEFQSRLLENRVCGDQDSEVMHEIEALLSSNHGSEVIFDAYRRVTLSSSKSIGPRIIGLLTAEICIEERVADDFEELIFSVCETLNDSELLDIYRIISSWLEEASNTANKVRTYIEYGYVKHVIDESVLDTSHNGGLKPNGTKTYYKDFLPMSMGALNAITMKIKMQYYKRSYWNILFRTKMKDARKNLIR